MDTCSNTLTSLARRINGHVANHDSVRKNTISFLLLSIVLAVSGLTHAASVTPDAALTIPNGDFSNVANTGTVGGGVLGGSGTASIGTGPWSGTYQGALGLLAPPSLSINGGKATIGGLLGVSAVGIVNNNGRLHQDTGIALIPNRRYTVSADIDAGTTLGVSVLTSGNAGIALGTGTSIASRIASSATVGLASINLIQGTTYRVSVSYQTGNTVSGNLFIHAFSEPVGLLTANLLGSISYDNIELSTHLLTQTPSALVAGNPGPYSAVVGQAATPALSIRVLDALGDPIPGVTVTFTMPGSGASASVVPNPAVTGANGLAQVVTTANTLPGTYTVSAVVSGVATPFTFNLTNVAGAAASVGDLSGSGQGAVTNTPFTAPLGLQALDKFGNPVSGAQVTFTAPTEGASAAVGSAVVTTGVDGYASTGAVANGIAGGYQIDVGLVGVGTVASFDLINMLDPSITPSNPNGPGQNASIDALYSCALLARIVNADGVPQPDLAVQFSAPSSGASATLSDGVSNGISIETKTDADGLALVEATGNNIEGSFVVSAQLKYSLAAPITYPLRNLAPNDPMYANGFDGPCISSVGLRDAVEIRLP